jgi:NADH dehydrogenase [ubiquinone] 1 alpha subcomplex assembly factor 6
MASFTLSYCAEQARRFDNDRFLCSLFAPEPRRESIWAIYALNIELARLPEMGREPLLRQIRLAWWRERIDDVFAGRPGNHAVLQSLARAVDDHGISRCHIDRLLEGRAHDLETDPVPDTMADLVAYVDATSASVTWLVLEVLDGRRDADTQAAGHVGVAWGLVGLMRAVPFHARHGRSYLPRALDPQAAVPTADERRSDGRAHLRSAVAKVIDVAAEDLRQARTLRSSVSRAALPALLPATFAESYVKRFVRAGHNPFDPRIEAPSPLRLYRLWLNCRLGRY